MATALVTGAGKRLGRSMALELGRRGFDVAVHYATSQDEADAVVQEIIGMGQRAVVKLTEAAPVTGGLVVELVSLEGKTVRHGPKSARGKPPRRKKAQARRKSDKTARKVKRTRQKRG